MPTHDKNENVSSLKRFRKYFSEREKPTIKEPKMPYSIAALNSETLSDWMAKYSAWREFTDDLLIDAMSEELRLLEKYNSAVDLVTLALPSGMKVRERDARINQDSQVKKLKLSLDEAELYRQLLDKRRESYTDCLAVISREITRRGNNL